MSSQADITADVAIIGSGVAGALIAYRLAQRGVKAVILEAGPRFTRGEALERQRSTWKQDHSAPYPNTKLAPRSDPTTPNDYIVNDGPVMHGTNYLRGVGGTTWHWQAVALRYLPADMELKSRYGIGRDWPLTYNDLEPDYAEAEKELGVNGDNNADWGSPRSTPYPIPVIAPTYADQKISSALKKHGIDFLQKPTARNTIPYDGRPACHGHRNCANVCPIGAQYSGDVHVLKAEELGVQVIPEALVYAIEVSPDNTIQSLKIRRPDHSVLTASAKIYVLAANGIESPRLCLASAHETLPNGITNSSGMVGKHLMNHYSIQTRFDMPYPVYPGRGPQTAFANSSYRDGGFRTEYASFLINFENVELAGEIAAFGLADAVDIQKVDDYIRRHITRRLAITAVAEQLPDPTNTVKVDFANLDSAGMPKIRIHYDLDTYTRTALTEGEKFIQKIIDHLGGQIVNTIPPFENAHPTGTLMMGHDPRFSVADAYGRSHDHSNMFIAGSSLFPTSGTANPTLTIAAMALRTEREIYAQLAQ